MHLHLLTVLRWYADVGVRYPTREQLYAALGQPPAYHRVALCANCAHTTVCGREFRWHWSELLR